MVFLLLSNSLSYKFLKRFPCFSNITRNIYSSKDYDINSINYNISNLNSKDKIMDKYQKELQNFFKNNDDRIKEIRNSLYKYKKGKR